MKKIIFLSLFLIAACSGKNGSTPAKSEALSATSPGKELATVAISWGDKGEFPAERKLLYTMSGLHLDSPITVPVGNEDSLTLDFPPQYAIFSEASFSLKGGSSYSLAQTNPKPGSITITGLRNLWPKGDVENGTLRLSSKDGITLPIELRSLPPGIPVEILSPGKDQQELSVPNLDLHLAARISLQNPYSFPLEVGFQQGSSVALSQKAFNYDPRSIVPYPMVCQPITVSVPQDMSTTRAAKLYFLDLSKDLSKTFPEELSGKEKKILIPAGESRIVGLYVDGPLPLQYGPGVTLNTQTALTPVYGGVGKGMVVYCTYTTSDLRIGVWRDRPTLIFNPDVLELSLRYGNMEKEKDPTLSNFSWTQGEIPVF